MATSINSDSLDHILRTTIHDFVGRRETFTAYDVTQTARKRWNVQMRHMHVRDSIHAIMKEYVDNNEYSVGQHPKLPALQYFAPKQGLFQK